MKKTQLKSILSFGIASLLTLVSIISVLTKNASINENGEVQRYQVINPVIYAAAGLIIVLVLIVIKVKLWKYLFAILVLLALFGVIQFHYYVIHFGIEGLISFELTAIILLSLHLYSNPEILYKRNFSPEEIENQNQKKQESDQKSISSFMLRFNSKSEYELKQIVQDDKYVPDAIEAAKRLLGNKGK